MLLLCVAGSCPRGYLCSYVHPTGNRLGSHPTSSGEWWRSPARGAVRELCVPAVPVLARSVQPCRTHAAPAAGGDPLRQRTVRSGGGSRLSTGPQRCPVSSGWKLTDDHSVSDLAGESLQQFECHAMLCVVGGDSSVAFDRRGRRGHGSVQVTHRKTKPFAKKNRTPAPPP